MGGLTIAILGTWVFIQSRQIEYSSRFLEIAWTTRPTQFNMTKFHAETGLNGYEAVFSEIFSTRIERILVGSARVTVKR